jgi:hypothetical protein
VDIIASYWAGDAIAHIIVSFGFAAADFLAVSIETRRERNESYSSIAGFFKQYELFYVVADERDLLRLRTNYRNDPPEDVYLYRIRIESVPAVAAMPVAFFSTISEKSILWRRHRSSTIHLRLTAPPLC